MKAMIHATVVWVLGICLTTGPLLAAERRDAPDLKNLVQVAAKTIERFQTGSSSWRTLHLLPLGETIEVKIISDIGRSSWDFTSLHQGKTNHLCRLVRESEIWYVVEADRVIKYRPQEAELPLPDGHQLLDWSRIRYLRAEGNLALSAFDRHEDGAYHYYLPLGDDFRAALTKSLQYLEKQQAQGNKFAQHASIAQAMETMREMLAKGVLISINEQTGLITRYNLGNVISSMEDFQFIDEVPEAAFAIPDDLEIVDRSSPIAESDLGGYTLVERDPAFDLNKSTPNTDGYLLNPVTGDLRRLPYQGNASEPVGFLETQREVLLIGGIASGQGDQLVKIDLITRENTLVEYDVPEGIVLRSATLSPDKKKIAIVQQAQPRDMLQVQIYIFDLETGESKPLARPQYIEGRLAWLPDGQGLILNRTIHSEDNEKDKVRGNVVRLGLNGKYRFLMRGGSAIVLPKSEKILFQEAKTGLWHTCDLDGKNPKLYADGLADYQHPAVSPDETQILFSRHGEKILPRLTLFDFGKAQGKPVPRPRGYLAKPVW